MGMGVHSKEFAWRILRRAVKLKINDHTGNNFLLANLEEKPSFYCIDLYEKCSKIV